VSKIRRFYPHPGERGLRSAGGDGREERRGNAKERSPLAKIKNVFQPRVIQGVLGQRQKRKGGMGKEVLKAGIGKKGRSKK